MARRGVLRNYEAWRKQRRKIAVYDNNFDPVLTVDPAGIVIAVNDGYEERSIRLGHPVGHRIYRLFEESEQAAFRERAVRAADGKPQRFETVVCDTEGRRCTVDVKLIPVVCGGRYEGYHLVLNDISEQKKLAAVTHELSSRYRRLVDMSLDAIVIYVEGRIAFLNDAGVEKLGGRRDMLIGTSIFDYVHPDYRAMIVERIRYMMAEGKQTPLTELVIVNLRGETIDVETTGIAIQYEGKPAVLTIVRDISARKQHERDIVHLAYHDSLTGLPNRRWFDKHVFELLEDAMDKGKTAALLFIDFDMFKHVNDAFGHQFGDLLLQEMTRRLQSELDGRHIVVRMGGDEFTLLMVDADDEAEVVRRSESILRMFREPFHLMEMPFYTTCSVGIALFPKHGTTAFKLLKSADIALYQAKRRRDCAVMYDPAMESDALVQLSVINDLHQALDHSWFELHYQPQVDIRSGRLVGSEALVRLRHPERGLIPPGQFIPVAESSGLITAIGEWILREACRQNMAWIRQGFPPMPVSINISLRQFQEEKFVGTVIRALEDSGMPPHLLDLEITESCTFDTPRLEQALHALKPLGMQVSIDDFGTGYSSLSYLSKLRVDKLKIDRSFIVNMTEQERDANLVRAMVGMAHNLQMKVVAEGLEETVQAELLREWGCDTGQGFFYARPLTAEQMASYLDTQLLH